MDEVIAPDITDRDTVINFALMAANAYTLVPGTGDWEVFIYYPTELPCPRSSPDSWFRI